MAYAPKAEVSFDAGMFHLAQQSLLVCLSDGQSQSLGACPCRVRLRLLDVPAVVELLSGLPAHHFPLAWAQTDMASTGQPGRHGCSRDQDVASTQEPGTTFEAAEKVSQVSSTISSAMCLL